VNLEQPILSARDVDIEYPQRGRALKAVRRCTLDIYKDELLVIVGESGAGKSTFAKALLGVLDGGGTVKGGSIRFEGENILNYETEEEWQAVRGGQIVLLPREPSACLYPLQRIGGQLVDSIALHQELSGPAAKEQAVEALRMARVSEPERRMKQFPQELSAGMRRRVALALALTCRPQILICDEPSAGLEPAVQQQFLHLLREIQRLQHITIVCLTRDLGVAAKVADRVAVMYAGQIVEYGLVDEIFYDPWHPYTWALLSALPQLARRGETLPTLEGQPPDPFAEITGDLFAPRNPQALTLDFQDEPPFSIISETHQAKCWQLDPRAPKLEQPLAIRRVQERILG